MRHGTEAMMIETENDRMDKIVLLANQLMDQVCRVMALAKEKQTNVESIVYAGNDGNDAVAYAYDYKTVKMTSSTTLDKLAQDELGDPALGPLISYFNKIQNEHALPAGTDIKIPILTRQERNLNNRIYAAPESRDNYGRDIALTDSGGFAIDRGDFAIVKGPKNLHQALGDRLTTASEKRIRAGTFGLRNSIGDPAALGSYLLASVEQTVKEEPRVERIDEIQFEGKGDKLYIAITFTDINGNHDSYKGDI
jgi:hypothetical protein